MISQKKHWFLGMVIVSVWLATVSCSLLSGLSGGTTTLPTPTPTTFPVGGEVTPTLEVNPCEGVSGTVELQLLVGPSEAVGLTPFAFAAVPFTVVNNGGLYLVQGNGPVEYYEAVLTAEWGTYTVTFDGETTVQGECVADGADGMLNLIVEMDGEQIVEVVVDGVTYTYPWAGTPSVEASLPILEGAEVGGEGWDLILHLN